jgi:multidrug efflux pump
MTSDSSAGLSTIILQFGMDRDIDIAAQDVQAAIRHAAFVAALPARLQQGQPGRRADPR